MQQMNITLYGMIPYDRSGKVRWLLEEMGLPYQDRWLDRGKREHEAEAYLQINPMGRVPAVVIDERPMIESGAICAYLADLHPNKGLAPSMTSPERLEYQQWMYFSAATLDGFSGRIGIIEDIPPGAVLETKMSTFLSDVADAAITLDRALMNREFLTGSFSAADICASYNLYFANLWPEIHAVFARHPRVLAYLEQMKQRPAAQRARIFSFKE